MSAIDFRQHPELYQIGRGEQGVLSVEPYKSEILPYWRFKMPEIVSEFSEKIYALFLDYRAQDDFMAWTWRGSSCKWGTPQRGAKSQRPEAD